MPDLISSDRSALLSVDDLADDDITRLLERARSYPLRGGAAESRPPFTVGLLFLSSSLRTRVGFEVAAGRLGGAAIAVLEARSGPTMSASESFDDTLRTISGMVDVVVARTPFALDRNTVLGASSSPVVNGGDGPGTGEHPTQALIDLFAIENEFGPVSSARIGLCGDLRMRSARSLIKALNRRLPAELVLISPRGRSEHGVALSKGLAGRTSTRTTPDFGGLDVLYMAGLPAGDDQDQLDSTQRAPYSLTKERIEALPKSAVVLSPLPIIDEIDPAARLDPRVRMFAQSDGGVHVRMAVLEHMLDQT
jgi:aspartate carbamoyltransferase catalytic subunit